MNQKSQINSVPTSKEVVQFYHSLPDPVFKAKFMRNLATRANMGIETMNNCFNRLSMSKEVRAVASKVINETKLELAGEGQTV